MLREVQPISPNEFLYSQREKVACSRFLEFFGSVVVAAPADLHAIQNPASNMGIVEEIFKHGSLNCSLPPSSSFFVRRARWSACADEVIERVASGGFVRWPWASFHCDAMICRLSELKRTLAGAY